MRLFMVVLPLFLCLIFLTPGCGERSTPSTIPTNSAASPGQTQASQVSATSATASPLNYLLQAVPADNISSLMFNDIPYLSASQNQAIPSRDATPREKIDWWTTFQFYIITNSNSFPTVADVSGFDVVDLEGALTVMYRDQTTLNIYVGHLDITALREKLKPYQYTEESYLGYPIFYGIPQPTLDIGPLMADLSPRAFGVIEGVKTSGDTVSLIIRVNKTSGNDVIKAKNTIQSVLQAYQDKTTLAYRSGGLTALANSLGGVGAAFITEDPNPETGFLEGMTPEKRESYVGPGKLTPYGRLAITQGKDKSDFVIDFILEYDSNATAQSNAETLQKRLSEAQSSIRNKPLSELWTVKEVKTMGPYLHGKVKQIERPNGTTEGLVGMVFAQDYLFLYPN